VGKNTLVINCDVGEVRVALIENGILSELHVERKAQRGIAGNVYLGRVSRVLPGMSAAFIDIGEERAAFLHVEDLIRPADFEAYLAGKGGHDRENLRNARRSIQADETAEAVVDEDVSGDDDEEEEAIAAPEGEGGAEVVEPPDAPVLRELREEGEVVELTTDKDPEMAATRRRRRGGRGGSKRKEIITDVNAEGGAVAELVEGAEVDGDEGPEGGAEAAEGAAEGAEGVEGAAPKAPRTRTSKPKAEPAAPIDPSKDVAIAAAAVEVDPEIAAEFGFTVGDATPAKPAAREGRERGRGRGERGRDRGRGREGGGREGGSRDRGDKPPPKEGGLRLARTTPINEVVKEGQEVIVQVTKDPIGTKGARVSSHISLPGRYVVYMPTVEHVGVSRRIGNDVERRRLREAIDAMKPPQGGLIVRTVAEGLTKKHLKSDVGYLVRLWGEIAKKKESGVRAPAVLYSELDVVLRTARDMFTDDVEKIVIDDREQYQRLQRFIEMFMPERAAQIELYDKEEPIFDAYGLEDEIARALSRKVPLESGGYLIIDQAEALTAIDVNSGRFVGKGNKDPEDTILQTNLEAVQEIAYQLRFRNIGGLIVLDLIDMEKSGNREKVYRALEQALLADKAKTSINRISELGLVEMTRKRTRESLGRMLNEPCFYCDGTGHLQSRTTIAYEILRQIRRERQSLPGFKVIVNAHPSVVDVLKTDEREALRESERRYQRQILLVPHKEYHLEQFDLTGN